MSKQEPMSRSMQLPYLAYVTAFLQTYLFLVYLSLSVCLEYVSLVMTLPRGSYSWEIWSKNKSVNGNAVTGI